MVYQVRYHENFYLGFRFQSFTEHREIRDRHFTAGLAKADSTYWFSVGNKGIYPSCIILVNRFPRSLLISPEP